MYALQFIGVMVATALVDVCWTFYFINVSREKALWAGWWSTLIVAFGAVVTVSYVNDPTLLVAAFIGAFAGTSLTIQYNKGKK